jgi:branched-chain amino acid transport system permease protein
VKATRRLIQSSTLAGGMILLLALPLLFRSASARNILILVFLYGALAQAWNVLGGLAGQISLGNAIFFAVGAYTATLLLVHAQLSPWVGMIVGMVVAVVLALIIGYPVFRLGGHYFAIATIAVTEIARTVMTNLDAAGGSRGISLPLVRDAHGMPTDSWYYLQFNNHRLPYYYLALALMLLTTGAVVLIDRTKPGYYLKAIKNDQVAARALGIHVTRYKLFAIAVSAAMSAMVGAFYAQYLLFIDPDVTLALQLSVLIALVAILGGAGSVWGPTAGAFVLIPLSEFTRTHLGGGGKAIDLVLYGVLIILISIFQPAGIAGLVRRIRRRRPRRSGRMLPTGAEEIASETRPLV